MSDPMRDLRLEFASRFWSFGNYIVGFGLVQMLTFLYALVDHDFVAKIDNPPWGMPAAIVLSTFISCSLVGACHTQERTLLKAGNAAEDLTKAARIAALGRVLVLILTGVGGILLFHLARAGA